MFVLEQHKSSPPTDPAGTASCSWQFSPSWWLGSPKKLGVEKKKIGAPLFLGSGSRNMSSLGRILNTVLCLQQHYRKPGFLKHQTSRWAFGSFWMAQKL